MMQAILVSTAVTQRMSNDVMTAIARNVLKQRDQNDPLAGLREAFYLPPDILYLDGNSLGVMPHRARQRAMDVITQEWGTKLIHSWVDNDWLQAPVRVGDKIAALIGAKPGEVIVADSTSINLFKVLVTALQAEVGFESLLYDDHIGKVSLIGAGMRSHPGITAKFFTALADAGVNLGMISTSEIRISVVVAEGDVDAAVAAAHTAFDLDADEVEAVVYGGSGR